MYKFSEQLRYTEQEIRFILAIEENKHYNQGGMNTPDNLATVQFLLNIGANPNITDRIGDTPLHDAATVPNNLAVVQTLLEMGADPTIMNFNAGTPKDIARDANIAQLLKDYEDSFDLHKEPVTNE